MTNVKELIMSKRRICLIGEVMVELYHIDCAGQSASVGVAGDSYNTAVHLARQLDPKEWAVHYVTLLGRDPLSDQIVHQMQAEAIDVSLVGRHPDRLPGLYAVEVDGQGERSFHYWRSNSAARLLFSEAYPDLDDLDGSDAVFLSLISLAILPTDVRKALLVKLAALRAKGSMICFDSNYRPKLWPDVVTARACCADIWATTSIALPSRDDEAALWPGETVEDLLHRIAGSGVDEIALKNGASGPVIWQGECLKTEAFHRVEKVVDTSGAGDAFNGGYLAARLQGSAPASAAQKGHALAAWVITQQGALPRGDVGKA